MSAFQEVERMPFVPSSRCLYVGGWRLKMLIENEQVTKPLAFPCPLLST